MKKIVFLMVSLLTTIGLYAQPNGSCYTGTTHLGNDGKLYGCVNEEWRPLAERSPATSINITGDFLTQRIGNTVYVKENGKAYDMKNAGFTPIDINGVEHQIGKIIYSSSNKHFYQGVENGKWWQIDNPLFSGSVDYDEAFGYETVRDYGPRFLGYTGPLSKIPDGTEVTLYNCYNSPWFNPYANTINTTFVEIGKPFIKRTIDGNPYIDSKALSYSTHYTGPPIDIIECEWYVN